MKMKYFSILLMFATILVAGSVNAQSASRLNGGSYTYVIFDNPNGGEGTLDKITFNNNTASSEQFSAAKGFKSMSVTEQAEGESSTFEVVLQNDQGGTTKLNGTVSGVNFYGTIVTTNSQGATTNGVFRGMTSEEWDYIQKMKTENKE